MADTITVIDRPKHPPLANPLPGGVFYATSRNCAVCGRSDPIVDGVFQHRCVLSFGG